MDIQDRVALVTGAGTGTDQAISQRLAERDATVALTDVPGCAETSRRIHEAGGIPMTHPAPLTET
jgi:NAD(P)-dependent dehydrogenase (short-subunit alcohol dehydrogenase family)